MTYQLALQGVRVAAYTLTAGAIEEVGGRRAIVVEGHARSVGVVDLVARIDDRFTSWIDVETGRPLRFQTAEYETRSKTSVEHVVVDFAARQGDRVPVSFHVNDAAPLAEPQQVRGPDVWDYNAFLVALRAWEQAPGTTVSVGVFRSRWLWQVEMTVRGKERISTGLAELGDISALRFDAHLVKLNRAGAKHPGDAERDLSIWISDDDGRVPLRTVARTDYGPIEMTLEDYQAGTGERLRP
jgi:hypothetical protein